ncbi:MAG: hypothetical protein R6U91_06700 [Bacillota bacterium]
MKKLIAVFLTLLLIGALSFSVMGCDEAVPPEEMEEMEEENGDY